MTSGWLSMWPTPTNTQYSCYPTSPWPLVKQQVYFSALDIFPYKYTKPNSPLLPYSLYLPLFSPFLPTSLSPLSHPSLSPSLAHSSVHSHPLPSYYIATRKLSSLWSWRPTLTNHTLSTYVPPVPYMYSGTRVTVIYVSREMCAPKHISLVISVPQQLSLGSGVSPCKTSLSHPSLSPSLLSLAPSLPSHYVTTCKQKQPVIPETDPDRPHCQHICGDLPPALYKYSGSYLASCITFSDLCWPTTHTNKVVVGS